MKTKTFLTVFAVTALAVAQGGPIYAPGEAAKHVGETATVKGTVDGVSKSQNII